MSPRSAGASALKSATGATVSPPWRSSRRSSVDTISSEPSGRNPRPDGETPGSGSVVIDPLTGTVCTASPSISENHSRPSNQRGPSPKQNPVASGVSPSTIAVIKGIQFSRDRPVVGVDLGGVDLLEQGVGQRGVFVRLDGHRPSEQRDVFARPAELILDRDASLQAAVAVAVMAKGPNGTEHPQPGPGGDRQMPGKNPIAV